MREISKLNQQLIAEAEAHGLKIDLLRKSHGLKFALKLFKHLKKSTEKGESSISFLYPKESKLSINGYVKKLRNAGIRIGIFYEDFVDEDTGEIVSIKRYYFRPLSK